MSGIAPGSTRFARLEQLFHDALDCTAETRAAFLARACAADPALRVALGEMLAYAEADDTGVRASIGALADTMTAPADRSGERIGPYQLRARIRYGGMAEVYAARRADGQFEQEVAIKIARGDRARAGMATLFAAERGVLARLRHPHICQFFDGGSTAAGEPYFVMERLVGAPLPQACREQDLSWHAVTGHFLDLCSAVAHIHAQLIVHRDIKPDNVLIADSPTGPRVKLLDFGIAGLLAADGGSAGGNTTDDHWYSPHYAAPEVVAGEAGGVAVDVYSLGCLLRDLAPCFAAGRRAEVACIAAHASAADPAARYPGVEALADDLRRMRDRRPIALKRQQPAYRLWRFVQRHALALALGFAATALVALTLWRETHLRHVAEAATAVALKERDKAGAIRDFLLQAYDAANPYFNDGNDPSVSELLDQQLTALETGTTLAVEARLELLRTLGDALMNLGRFERAEHGLASGMALAEAELPAGSVAWARLAVSRAQNAQRSDQFDRSQSLFKAIDADPDAAWRHDAEALQIQSVLYSSWAVLEQRLDHLDRAETLIRRGLETRREWAASRQEVPELAYLLITLGSIQSARAELDQALVTFASAYAENQSRNRRFTPSHLALLGWIGITLDKLGHAERAEPYLIEAIEVAEKLFPRPHPRRSSAYGNLGTMYLVNGRYAEAAPLLQRGLDVLKAMGDDRSAVYQTRLHNLGRLALEREDLITAAPLLAESLRLRKETLGDRHERTAQALLASATLALSQSRPRRALAMADEALGILRGLEDAVRRPLLPTALLTAAEAHAAMGRAQPARVLLADFRAATTVPPTAAANRQSAPVLLQLGRVLQALGDSAAAVAAYTDAITAFGGEASCGHPVCAQTELRLAALEASSGDMPGARARLARARPVLAAALVENAATLQQLRELERKLVQP